MNSDLYICRIDSFSFFLSFFPYSNKRQILFNHFINKKKFDLKKTTNAGHEKEWVSIVRERKWVFLLLSGCQSSSSRKHRPSINIRSCINTPMKNAILYRLKKWQDQWHNSLSAYSCQTLDRLMNINDDD